MWRMTTLPNPCGDGEAWGDGDGGGGSGGKTIGEVPGEGLDEGPHCPMFTTIPPLHPPVRLLLDAKSSTLPYAPSLPISYPPPSSGKTA
jgi:hypothetical protein